MSKLLEDVSGKVYHGEGAAVETVIEAENKLGLHFSDEFRNYLMEYGVASFGNHEFLGLGGDSYLDVVGETLRERNNSGRFPKNCYLVENLGIDSIFILQDEEGNVYESSAAGTKKIFSSLKDYVRSLV
jgi:hypothetical protein